MKKGSLRLRLILWFSLALLLVMALAFFVAISLGWTALQKGIRDILVHTVEANVDEVEFFSSWAEHDTNKDSDQYDQYIEYAGGWLEIDDDYLNRVNGIYTALYAADGELLYGENPIIEMTLNVPYQNEQVLTLGRQGYYLYDRQLSAPGVEGLWLRGIVSRREGIAPLSDTVRMMLVLLPVLVAVAIVGGILFVNRALKPVRRISDTLSAISGGDDLKARIDAVEGNDEFGRIAGAANKMLSRLEASFETERRFASDVSHELRTPMAVIRAQCEYALGNDLKQDEYRKALAAVNRQNAHMTGIVGDMLALYRMENGKGREGFVPLNASALVRETAEDLAFMGDKGITLHHEIAEDITVFGDEMLLRRLLMNLILNAYQYGRENGEISVSLKKTGEEALLLVSDNGIGIGKEDQARVFDRFFRSEGHHAGTGTGLGLSMVRQIALLHFGKVWVDSEKEKGSRFFVALPLYKKQ